MCDLEQKVDELLRKEQKLQDQMEYDRIESHRGDRETERVNHRKAVQGVLGRGKRDKLVEGRAKVAAPQNENPLEEEMVLGPQRI